MISLSPATLWLIGFVTASWVAAIILDRRLKRTTSQPIADVDYESAA
jgi:hypothetical protein